MKLEVLILLGLTLLLVFSTLAAQDDFVRMKQNDAARDTISSGEIVRDPSLSYQPRQITGYQQPAADNTSNYVVLALLIIAFVFIIILMIIQFKLRAELKKIAEIEEKKYRYKSRTLLKSIDEQNKELVRLREIAATSQRLQKTYEEMQRSTSRLDLLKKAIITIKHPVAITNLKGKIIFCNPELANLFNLRSSEILETNLYDLFRTDGAPIPTMSNIDVWQNTQIKLVTKGEGKENVSLLTKPELLMDSDKKPLAIVLSFIQLDEEPEQPETDQKSDYKLIFDNTKDVFFELDKNGKIIEISPSIKDLTQIEPEKALNKKLEFILADHTDHDNFLKAVHRQQEVDNFDVTISDADDKLIPCSITAKVIKKENDEEIRIIGSIRNVIERKREEQKRIKALRELEAVNKDLMNFAHITSHDLKSPLRAINTLANWILMDRENKLTSEAKKHMQLLIDRSERMHRLIEAIFEYINIVNFQAEKVKIDMNKMLQNIIHKISVPQNFSIQIDEKLPTIFFERTRIEQIFENLLENSIRFMDKKEGKIIIKGQDKGSMWEFSVTDNGPGIEEKYFDKVFQIFQTLDPIEDNDGTGIGLALVKKIIDKYNGKIWLRSKPEAGLSVIFTIPKTNKES